MERDCLKVFGTHVGRNFKNERMVCQNIQVMTQMCRLWSSEKLSLVGKVLIWNPIASHGVKSQWSANVHL